MGISGESFPRPFGPSAAFPFISDLGPYSVFLAPVNPPYERITDHCEEAKAQLLVQFQGKPMIEGMLCALIGPMQLIEDTLWHMLTRMVDLDVASGVQLDVVGKILGLARNNLTDDDYRSRLKVWRLVLKSSGLAEELIEIADLFDDVSEAGDTVQFVEGTGTAGSVVFMHHLMEFTPQILADFLEKATTGGHETQLVTPTTATSNTVYMGYDDETGAGGVMGYDGTDDPATHGLLGATWTGA